MTDTIHCPHCGAAHEVRYEPEQGPQRRVQMCEICANPMTVFISLYADGRGIVSVEAKRIA